MKKTLTNPEIKFVRFTTEDVITTSGDPSMLAGFRSPAVDDTTGKSLSVDFGGLTWNQ